MNLTNLIKKTIFCAVMALTFLTSCSEMTEEIFVNEDGSGEYLIYTDMLGTMRNTMIQMDEMMTPDSIRNNETEEEKLARIEERIWQDFPESVDSVMDISDRVDPEELSAESKALMEKTIMFMKGGKEEGQIKMGLKFNFADLNDLNNFLVEMAENQKKNPQSQGMFAGGEPGDSKMEFEMSKKKFSRAHTILKKPEIPSEQLAMVQMMMKGKIRTIVHLPKKVKKVKGDHFVSKDGKTVVFEYDLMDYVKGDLEGDFEIKMKKR